MGDLAGSPFPPPDGRVSRRRVLAAAGGLAAAVLVAGCQSMRRPDVRSFQLVPTPGAHPPVTSGAPPPVSHTPAATLTRVPRVPTTLKPVPRNRTFVSVGVGGEAFERFTDVDLQNPFVPGISRSGYQIVMEPLFYYNPYHTSTTCGPPGVPVCSDGEIPWLAVYYSYNADYTTAVVNLREGVKWSDSTPFTANDVVFTMNMLKNSAPYLRWSIDIQQWVGDVTALDDHTVEFTLTAPNPRFIFQYFMFHEDFGVQIVPEHIFSGKDPRTFNNFDLARGWPVVTGPYRLVYSDPQQKIWDRRDDWWGARTGFQPLPAAERLIFLPGQPEATMVDMIDRNEVDTSLNVSIDLFQRAEAGNANVTSWTGRQAPFGYTDYWVTGLGFNDSLPPFSDPDIRWAINFAINRDELVALGYHGAGKAALIPFLDFPALKPYLDGIDDLIRQYGPGTFDPARSAQILRSKGYTQDRLGFWTSGGKRFTIPMVTLSVEQDIATVLLSQLRQGGFDATLSLPADYLTPIYTGTARAYVFGHGGGVRDPYGTVALYHSRLAAPTGQRAAEPYRWKNSEYDQIVDQMATVAPSDPQLGALFHQAMAIWLPALPDIGLTQFYHRIPVNTTYWTGWPDATDPYVNTANWHRTFEMILLTLKPTS